MLNFKLKQYEFKEEEIPASQRNAYDQKINLFHLYAYNCRNGVDIIDSLDAAQLELLFKERYM